MKFIFLLLVSVVLINVNVTGVQMIPNMSGNGKPRRYMYFLHVPGGGVGGGAGGGGGGAIEGGGRTAGGAGAGGGGGGAIEGGGRTAGGAGAGGGVWKTRTRGQHRRTDS
eukprot:XP_019925258.1 PREDICTED: glycine-rich protein 23-like [Crassostrea gigas]